MVVAEDIVSDVLLKVLSDGDGDGDVLLKVLSDFVLEVSRMKRGGFCRVWGSYQENMPEGYWASKLVTLQQADLVGYIRP